MKRYMALALVLLLVFSMSACAGNGKSSIPALKEVLDIPEEQLSERLAGISHEEINIAWGEPDGQGSGFWLDYWHLDEAKTILVYYDADGRAETVKVMDALQ